METYSMDNPFYCQPVFSQADLNRATITWKDRLWLWMLPTAVQVNDGYAFFWKRWHDHIYLVKCEPMKAVRR